MRRKLDDVRFLNAIRVDRQENYFKSDNYDIEMDLQGAVPFIHVTHKVSGKTGTSTAFNMVDMHVSKEVETTKLKADDGSHVLRKRVVKPKEETIGA